MGLEGRKVSDNMVMFGEPLNERALKALQTRSPTADSIISSLPPSAFIPIQDSMQIIAPKKEKPEEIKVDKAKARREKKKVKFKEKKQKAKETIKENIEIKEKTILNTLIENNIKENIKENDSSNLIEEKENKMDLEKELEALSAKAQPKVQEEVIEVQEEQTPQADLRDQIMSLLGNEPNAPTMEHIEAWKEHYGKSGIHVMAFGEGEVYIYHHLTRGEWKKLKELMARLQESENADEIEEQLKEKVVMHCILWPSVDANWLDKCKAGVIDSLYQMILLNSGFLTPQQAMLLTTQL